MGVTDYAVGLPKAGIAINTASVLVDISPLCLVCSLQYAVTLICLAQDAGPQPCLLCYLSWPVKALWLNTILTTQMLAGGDGRDWLWVVDMNAVSTDWWNWILVLGRIPSEWSWWWVPGSLVTGGSCEMKIDRYVRVRVLPAPSSSFFVQRAWYTVWLTFYRKTNMKNLVNEYQLVQFGEWALSYKMIIITFRQNFFL